MFRNLAPKSVLATMLTIIILLFVALPAQLAPATRVVLIGTIDALPLPPDVRIVEVYDAFVLAEVRVGDLPELQTRYDVDLLAERTTLSLDGVVFDTLQGDPVPATGLRAAPDDPYFVIQFYGPVKNEWVSNLEEMGVSFLGYHPSFSYIVRMDPTLLPQVRTAHAVQWVGPYHPAYRLASEAEMERALAVEGKLALLVRGFPGEDPLLLKRGLEGAGVDIELSSGKTPAVFQVWAELEQLPQLAALPGVYRVEPYDPPQMDNERAAQVLHTSDVWESSRNGLLQDLMGDGQVAGAVDSGLDNNSTSPTIEDFYDYTGGSSSSRVAYNAGGAGCGGFCSCYSSDDLNSSGHGTHVAGSIVGNGYNALQQRGLTSQATAADPSFDYAWGVGQAPEAEIAFAHVAGRYGSTHGTLCGLGSDPYDTWMNVYNAGARNVNNSWGNSTYSYGGSAQSGDEIMWDRQDYLVVTSASNAGPGWDTVAQPGTGKNILTVGAALHHRPAWGLYGDSTSLLTYFSSRGPVNPPGDGRAKPDIVAPGSQVLSTRSNAIAASEPVLWGNEPGDGDGDGRPDYTWSGGTSMSAPLATGAATIVRDYLQDIQGLGNTTPPSAALVKAFLLNGAVDMGYGYESRTSAPYGGRNLQGWGLINVEQSITPRAPRSFFYDDFTNITNAAHQSSIGFTSSGQWKQYTVAVVDSSEPLKITLHWTDRQGGSDGFAVNNLNLLVTAPSSGPQYIGNCFSGSWSVDTGSCSSYDTRNNAEAVYIRNPTLGTWTIRVTDSSHGGSTQPYALAVSGGLGPNPSYTRTDSNGRVGTSALPFMPSLKPLEGSREYTPANSNSRTSFRLTNWGTSADTISLSYGVTDMSGSSVAGVTVSFSPTGPFSLASGASQDVEARINVGAAVSDGPYDIQITATSGGSGNRRDGMVIPLNVIDGTDLSNEQPVVSENAPQYASAFWGTGNLLWMAYLSATNHLGGEAGVWASRSTDGGQTWASVGRVDAGDGVYYHEPAIAGNSDGSSITVVWPRPHSAVYARTWTSTGGWGSIRTLATYGSGEWRIGRPDVICDNNGDILAVWRAYDYDNATTEGVFYSRSTNNGGSWSAAAGVPDASCTDCTHYMPRLTLDTSRNDVWMAYAHNTNNRDIRLKRWDGDSNSWQTGNPVVASTSNREIRPGIGYIAATDALWVTWHRYAGFSNPTARLYYVRSNAGTLPNPTWGTTRGPYGNRTAESLPAMVVGDGTATYISYLEQSDTFRGNNIYMLTVPPAGGTPSSTDQICATVDDPPLYARGNAGSPQMLWLQTTVNGQTFTGPTLLYSKNPPDNQSPDYGTNRGVAQALFDMGENVDLYLTQGGNPGPTAIELLSLTASATTEGIRLNWETASQHESMGFNLYRADSPDLLGERLNDLTIPPQPPLGANPVLSYSFLDGTAAPGATYYYTLEDLGQLGRSEMYGAVRAMLALIYLPLAQR